MRFFLAKALSLDLSAPENLMILSVYLSLPDIDNKRRSIKTTESVRAGKVAGRWMGIAPYGYKNSRDEQNKPIILPAEKAGVVKKIFAELAIGRSQAEIQLSLQKKGMGIQRSTFSALVRNPVYAGKIWVKTADSGGYSVKRLHEPLVDEESFEKAQAAIQGNVVKKNITVAKTFKEELHLRGLLLCPSCGGKLTGSASKGRNGVRHRCYHCNHCGKERRRAEETHQRVEALLSEFQATHEANKLYEMMVKKLLQGKEKSARPKAKIEAEIQQYETRLKNSEDDLADRNIDLETFHQTKARYVGEINKLRRELEDTTGSNQNEMQKLLKRGIHVLQDLPRFYKKAPYK